MENFEDKTYKDDGSFDLAVDTTYKIVTGKIAIEEFKTNGRLYMLYDPIDVTEKEIEDILNDIIEYYIDTEEYEKCKEIKDILESDIKELIPKITFDDKYEAKDNKLKFTNDYSGVWPNSALSNKDMNPIDKMIDVLKKLNAESTEKAFRKIEKDFAFTNLELWSIMSDLDKEIFYNSFDKFEIWANKLTIKLRNYYTDRLVNEQPLIPTKEENIEYSGYDYENINNLKVGESGKTDYNNIVISFIDNFTCISNYDISRIHRIKFQLLTLGIIDSEIREKKVDGKILYTLVYKNTSMPTKLDWN